MGSKRIGHARVEALLENLNRELSMGGSTIAGERKKVVLLTDAGAAGANRGALTAAESGTIFLVPALTTGTQTIALPAPSASIVGCTYKFVAVATTGQIFSLDTDTGDTKIVIAEPDGDGSVTVNTFNKMRFTAAADLGAQFEITCISTTAAHAWLVHGIVSGDASGTGEHVGAN